MDFRKSKAASVTAVMEKSPRPDLTQQTTADETLAADFAEMERRKRFIAAMLALTGVTGDQLVTRAVHVANRRQMLDFEAAAQRKIAGLLSGTIRLSSCEYKLVMGCVAGECKRALKNELGKRTAPAGLASIFSHQEKREKERRAVVLSVCLDLSGLTVQDLAPRTVHAGWLAGGEFENAGDVEQIAAKVIAKDTRLTDGQWQALARVFTAAAMQGIDREENSLAAGMLDPDPWPRMERNARLLAGCMAIAGITLDQAVQKTAYLGSRFGLDSLADGVEQKLRDVLGAKCVIDEVERSCILGPVLGAAQRTLADVLTPGREITATAERFSDMIRGCLSISELSPDPAAPIVARVAGRWFMGRLEDENQVKNLLKDSATANFTPEEQRVIAQALFAVPLRTIKQELELCK